MDPEAPAADESLLPMIKLEEGLMLERSMPSSFNNTIETTGRCACIPTRGNFLYTFSMATPQEVEIKFLVSDLKVLEEKLRAHGFCCETPSTHEVNNLYDLPRQKLRRKGELLRLRRYGDKWKLTYKAKVKLGRHKSRGELETGVMDGKAMDAILRAVGYSPSFIYEKFRAEWSDGEGKVVLDHTPIGDIAEIEGKSRWIDGTARTLGITANEYITKSYAELFFDWKRKTKCKAENMTFRECDECMKNEGGGRRSAQVHQRASSSRRRLNPRTR
jgi:adenylate cyclase class 2